MAQLGELTEIKTLAGKSIKWAVLGDLAPRLVTPLVTVVLSRLLSPTDYGIVGLVVPIIGLARILESLGLNQALIQTDQDTEKVADTIFWLNLLLSLLLYIFLFLAAPYIAGFLNEVRLVHVLRVMGLLLVISAFDDVQEAMLRRDFKFAHLMWRKIVPAFMPLFVTLPLALTGFGYWSLVAGVLSGNAVGVVLLWRVSGWKPGLRFEVEVAKSLIRFGFRVSLETLLRWAIRYGDRFVIGYLLSLSEVGYYTFAVNVVTLVREGVVTPISRVAYPTFSRLKVNYSALNQSFLDSMQLFAAVTFPATCGLAFVAEPLVAEIFGATWLNASPLISVMALASGFGWTTVIYQDLFRSLDRISITLGFLSISVCYMLPVYLLGSRFGVNGLAVARASIDLVFFIPHLIVAALILKIPWWKTLRTTRSPLIATFAMSCALLLLVYIRSGLSTAEPNFLFLIIMVVTGGGIYATALFLVDRPLSIRLVRVTKSVV